MGREIAHRRFTSYNTALTWFILSDEAECYEIEQIPYTSNNEDIKID